MIQGLLDFIQPLTNIMYFMLVSFITDVIVGLISIRYREDSFNTSKLEKGLLIKAAMLITSVWAGMVDFLFIGDLIISKSLMLVFAGTNAISILANLSSMGIKFPAKVEQFFKDMLDKENK